MLSLPFGAAVGFEQPQGQRFGLLVAQDSLGAGPKGLVWVGDSSPQLLLLLSEKEE